MNSDASCSLKFYKSKTYMPFMNVAPEGSYVIVIPIYFELAINLKQATQSPEQRNFPVLFPAVGKRGWSPESSWPLNEGLTHEYLVRTGLCLVQGCLLVSCRRRQLLASATCTPPCTHQHVHLGKCWLPHRQG